MSAGSHKAAMKMVTVAAGLPALPKKTGGANPSWTVHRLLRAPSSKGSYPPII